MSGIKETKKLINVFKKLIKSRDEEIKQKEKEISGLKDILNEIERIKNL
jgi:hypothetical protein